MKKIVFIVTLCFCILSFNAACTKDVDFTEYISELRENIYMYDDGDFTLKIYSGKRESPYCSDGICGDISDFCEVFVSFEKSPQDLEIYVDGQGGQMSYRSVTNDFYLSFTPEKNLGESVEIELIKDGKKLEFSAPSVKYDGVISPISALECVEEYDEQTFSSLKSGTTFSAEIYIRLLYDEGCYYYVGVCTQKQISAYLVDGENGNIIATRIIANEVS
jgi:hypothetical protein